MNLSLVYRMSEYEFVEILVEGNTTSDNHFMNFLDLLKAIWYSIIIHLSSIRRVFYLSFLRIIEFEATRSRSNFA